MRVRCHDIYLEMRKFDTLVVDSSDAYKLIGQDEVSKTYSFPKSYVCYRKLRGVSAEQRNTAKRCSVASADDDCKE